MGFNKKTTIIISILFSIIFLIVSIILIKKFTKNNHLLLSGTIESIQIDINSEISGKIIETVKDEGDVIKKDEIIAIVDSSLQKLVVKQYEALVKLKKARLAELNIGPRVEEIDQADVAVKSAKTNYEYWKDKYKRIKSIYDSGNISEMEYLDVKYKMDIAEQDLKKAHSRLNLLIKGSTYQTIKAAEADIEQTQAQLEQAELLLSKYEIRSSIDGTYLLRNIELGDVINVGTSIATISDLTDLWVKVYIPQKYIGYISLNQGITLKSKALENNIKGKIIYIADKAEFTPKNTETNESKENTVFKIKIKIVYYIDRLRPGMTVDIYISLK